MSERQFQLLSGDPYLCERSLAAREAALLTLDPEIERHALFADEMDVSALDIELRSVSLFAFGRHFVIRKIEKSRVAKKLAAVFEKPLPEGTYLTLVAGPLKATNAVLKAAKAQQAATQMPTPKGNALQREARSLIEASGLSLSNPVLRLLLSSCGSDLLALRSEIEKLRAAQGTVSEPADLTEATAQRLCFNHTETTIYPFYDRVGEGRLPEALGELDGLREDAGRIVGGIVRHLTRLVMVRLLLDQRVPQAQIAAKVGMQDWLCRRLIGQAKRRTFDNLASALRLGVTCDQRIKQGRLAPDDALMQLIFAATETAR